MGFPKGLGPALLFPSSLVKECPAGRKPLFTEEQTRVLEAYGLRAVAATTAGATPLLTSLGTSLPRTSLYSVFSSLHMLSYYVTLTFQLRRHSYCSLIYR